jgi:hypothetical protein
MTLRGNHRKRQPLNYQTLSRPRNSIETSGEVPQRLEFVIDACRVELGVIDEVECSKKK